MSTQTDKSAVNKWLLLVSLMVVIMVIIGAVTRLTDSGLSMVEWRPLVGSVPPLSETEWVRVFEKYKAFPEYQKVNHQMELSEFKRIFFWEYIHRLWGRLIGLAFIIPFLYLGIRKKIAKKLYPKLIVALILGGSQGVLGWYMVKSGLISNPDVSHYRLCAHLLLAFFILSYLTYIRLTLKHADRVFTLSNKMKGLVALFAVLLVAQIIYGAFVAGLDAGLTHNNFPKMGRHWIPTEVNIANILNFEMFNNTVFVQFIHRKLGWILLFLITFMFVKSKKLDNVLQKKSISHLTLMIFIQFVLGVSTLLLYVPISLGVIHQFGALILVLFLTNTLFFTFTKTSQKN